MIKRWWVLYWLVIMAVAPVFAVNVSIMVVETGLKETGGGKDTASKWESGMMDVFFDTGHIVSNARSIVLNGIEAETILETIGHELREAEEGGAAYFVLAVLDYENKTVDTKTPNRVSLRLYNIDKHTLIAEETYNWSKKLQQSDYFSNAKRAVRLIIPYMGGTI
jgi:hypothetical protein